MEWCKVLVRLCVEKKYNEGVCVACVSTGKQGKQTQKKNKGGVWALSLLGFWVSASPARKKEKK